jgi:hypothetical protein
MFIVVNQWIPTCGTRSPGVLRGGPVGVRENNFGNGGKHKKMS